MEIFIDTADKKEIARWMEYGVIDGVTTNPAIMLKDGVSDIEAETKEIALLVDKRPVSVEVTTNNLEEMLSQAQTFAEWASNIVIKIPVINADGVPCLGVIKTLEKSGIAVNATVAMSLGQVMLATKAGASYASIFAGRVADEGRDPAPLISGATEWVEKWRYKTKIIVGSIRGVFDIQTAALAGAHIITIPPQLLLKMMDHKYTRSTVNDFVNDAKKITTQK